MFKSVTGLGHGHSNLFNTLLGKLPPFLVAIFYLPLLQLLVPLDLHAESLLFEPYNNHAEQQMRKTVLVRKVSQQNRSDERAKTQAVLMTLFRSAELQGHNPIETILDMAKMAIGKKDISTMFLKDAA